MSNKLSWMKKNIETMRKNKIKNLWYCKIKLKASKRID